MSWERSEPSPRGSRSSAQQPAATPPAAPQGQAAPAAGRSNNLGSDANGNPLRLAFKTNHVSNYDESKVKPYTLPDPLVMVDGKPVRDARAWRARRAEILRMYETDIYGRIPANTPKVTWQVAETDPQAREGASIRKRIVGTIGEGADAPKINLTLHTPAQAKGAVPIILLVNFGGGTPQPPATRRAAAAHTGGDSARDGGTAGGAAPAAGAPAAAAGTRPRWSAVRSAGRGRDPRARLGLCDRGLQRHSTRPRQRVDAGSDRPHARGGARAASRRRVGNDQRLVVGHQPDSSTTSRPTGR